MNETLLIQNAKRGDKDSFCTLYGIYKDRLYRYAYYRLRNESDAEDAVSECVLSAWKQIGGLRDDKAFAGWIFRILSGCCGRLIKEQIDRKKEADLESVPEQAEESTSQIDDMILNEALSRLTDDERNIVLLSFISGFKSNEIADITGKTAGSVRSSLSRSLKKLRGYLS